MTSRKKITYEQHPCFDYGDKNHRRIMFASTFVLAASVIVSTSVGALDVRNQLRRSSDCKVNDETSIRYYEAKIEELYDSKPSEESTIYDSSGLLTVKMDTSDKSDRSSNAPLEETIIDTLSYLPPTLIAASEVSTVQVEDITSHSASGLYDYTSPHAITLDLVTLQNSADPVLAETSYPYDRMLIHDIAVHELGHAAVTNFCGTPTPPKEFTDANSLQNLPQRSDMASNEYTYVSTYAMTHPSEDIAETVEAMMGSPSLSGNVGVLQHGLETDNPTFLRKAAVVATMLDDLEPGAGEDAFNQMKMTRNELLTKR